jgi:hypothetical protein
MNATLIFASAAGSGPELDLEEFEEQPKTKVNAMATGKSR